MRGQKGDLGHLTVPTQCTHPAHAFHYGLRCRAVQNVCFKLLPDMPPFVKERSKTRLEERIFGHILPPITYQKPLIGTLSNLLWNFENFRKQRKRRGGERERERHFHIYL